MIHYKFYCTSALNNNDTIVNKVHKKGEEHFHLRYKTRYKADIVRYTLQRIYKCFPERLKMAEHLLQKYMEDWETTKFWCKELVKKEAPQPSETV